MKHIHLQIYKLSLALFLTTLLVACGGGGNSNNDTEEEDDVVDTVDGVTTGTVNTPGTGTCVSIVSPKVGDTSLIRNVTIIENNTLETDIRTTYTAVSNTSWTYESEGASEFGLLDDVILENVPPDLADLIDAPALTVQTTETFTITNNFISITKSEAMIPQIGLVTTTYSPARSSPINEVCEGQIYTQAYTETTVSSGGTDIEEVDVRIRLKQSMYRKVPLREHLTLSR